MSFYLFKCPKKDDLMQQLWGELNVTPMMVPDSQTQPLLVVAHRGKKSAIWGPIEDLFVDKSNFQVSLQDAQVADINVNSSQSIDARFGLKIMENILKGFNVKVDPLNAVISDVKEVSFSFKNVKKNYIPITTLGNALADMKININHPSFKIFRKDDNKRPYNMYLITGVLLCNDIELNLDKTVDDQLDIKAPVIQQITDAGMEVKEKENNKKAVVFKGDQPLTFAFSTIEIDVDPEGRIGFGEMVVVRKSVEGGEEVIEQKPKETSLIDEEVPGMLGWNSKEDL